MAEGINYKGYIIVDAPETEAARALNDNFAKNADENEVFTNKITQLRTELNEVKSKVQNLDTNVEKNETDIHDLQSQISQIESSISQLETDVEQNKTDIQEVSTSIAQIESNISQLQTDVTQNISGIATNQIDISFLQTQIDNLKFRTGWVRIVDVNAQDPGDTVTDKLFQDPPGNTILQTAISSSLDVTVEVESSYPVVIINENQISLTKVSGYYSGSIPITLNVFGTIEVEAVDPEGDAAAKDICTITLNLPPIVTNAVFVGSLPGSQTELKENDTFQLEVTADKIFDQVVLENFGAAKSATINVASGLTATITITIADRGDFLQNLAARLTVRDSVSGAFSDSVSTNDFGSTILVNVLPLNNLHPTVSISTITYPGSQQALKSSEQATVSNSASDYDTIEYTSPMSEISISNSNTFESSKTVTRIAGSYNISINNFKITAIRAANAAVTARETIVQIAAEAATVNVSEQFARLRSGGNDGTSAQNYTIAISSNQRLLNAPSLSPDSGGSRGTFVGSWTGGPSNWERSLQIHDNDEKGTFNWESLIATNLAGIVTNTISGDNAYTLGGFIARTVTWQAFQTISEDVNVAIADFSKIQAGSFSATGQQSIKFPVGTTDDEENGYTVNAVDAKPHNVIWLDQAAAGSNTGEAFLFSYQEVV